MAYNKNQLEALKSTLLASAQDGKITATKHRQMVQAVLDEMYDAQSRANLLAEIEEALILADGDKVAIISNGVTKLLDASLLGTGEGGDVSNKVDKSVWTPLAYGSTINLPLNNENKKYKTVLEGDFTYELGTIVSGSYVEHKVNTGDVATAITFTCDASVVCRDIQGQVITSYPLPAGANKNYVIAHKELDGEVLVAVLLKENESTGDFSGDYNDLTNKPTIPNELSDLSEDSTHRTVTDTEKTTWNGKANGTHSHAISDITGLQTEIDDFEDRISDLEASSGGGGGPAIAATYADITARNAGVGSRVSGEIVRVTDATGDTTVGTGGAYYEYLGTGTNFRKLSEDESEDLISGFTSSTFVGAGTTTLDLKNQALPANKITANAATTTVALTNVKAATAVKGSLKVTLSGVTLVTLTTPAGYTSRGATGVITSFQVAGNDGSTTTVYYEIDGTIIEWFYPSGDKATNLIAGLTKLSSAASDPTDPVALGVNDPRVNGDSLTLTDGTTVGWDGGNRADDTRTWTISGATRALNVSNFKDNGNYFAECTLNGVTSVTITLGGSGYTHKKFTKGGSGGTTISTITYNGADGSVFPLACKVRGTTVWWFVPSSPATGTATLVGGTVTVANTRITANSIVMPFYRTLGTITTPKSLYSPYANRVPGVSFTIVSSDSTDTSLVEYQIIEGI
jgi:hypothetical protein